jgi:arylsulfatase A-like enzyme
VISAAAARIERHTGGPMFMYLHVYDPHAPYASGGPAKSDFEGYLREVRLVDGLLARLRRAVTRAGKDDRVVWILTADHGDAFGQHDIDRHRLSVYEELLRVPLWIRVPGVRPRTVEYDVSLVDVGPTILDLMGQPTPGTFMGQSLVPFLRGGDVRLTRPLVVDTGRWQQAMIFPDQLKLIRDRRRGTFELYDLAADPKEEYDLFDRHPGAPERLDRLRAFFGVHALRTPDYRPPYQR